MTTEPSLGNAQGLQLPRCSTDETAGNRWNGVLVPSPSPHHYGPWHDGDTAATGDPRFWHALADEILRLAMEADDAAKVQHVHDFRNLDRPNRDEGQTYRISDRTRMALRDPAVGVRGNPTHDGWDRLADGPMPQDESLAHQLWRDWMQAEGEWAQKWALERYTRFLAGRSLGPITPRRKEKPLEDPMIRLAQGSDLGLRELAEAAIELEADAKDSPARVARPEATALFLKRAFPQRVTATGWYMAPLDRLGRQLPRAYCRDCIGDSWKGPKARAMRLTPLDPHEITGNETCAKCGRKS